MGIHILGELRPAAASVVCAVTTVVDSTERDPHRTRTPLADDHRRCRRSPSAFGPCFSQLRSLLPPSMTLSHHRHRGYRTQQPADLVTPLIARTHSSLPLSLASLFQARFRLAPATVRNVVIVVALAVENYIVVDLCCHPPGHSGTSGCRLLWTQTRHGHGPTQLPTYLC